MSRYHIPEADRRMLNLSEAQIQDIERTCSQYPVSEHHPVNLVVVTCGNRRNGRVCGNAIDVFVRESDSRRFQRAGDGSERALHHDTHFLDGRSADERRRILHDGSRLQLALGALPTAPLDGVTFQCAACGKTWTMRIGKLILKVRKFADGLEKMPVSQWADGEDLHFRDYAPGDRSRGAYPLISMYFLTEN